MLSWTVRNFKMLSLTWRWTLGMFYVVVVALIWIAASFVVQSVVDGGVSPFLITYMCNSLFVVYIPVVEAGWLLEGWALKVYRKVYNDPSPSSFSVTDNLLQSLDCESSEAKVAQDGGEDVEIQSPAGVRKTVLEVHDALLQAPILKLSAELDKLELQQGEGIFKDTSEGDKFFTRKQTALVGLAICPLWFLAQFSFNVSLKYTTVTSNTVLSTTSSLFTFLISLQFLGERFAWIKLGSVLLCMVGTVIVSLGDSWNGETEVATNPLLGDIFSLVSAFLYALYTALIRAKIPDEREGKGKVSTALVLGYIGLFNGLLLSPIAMILHFSGVEPFHRLTPSQYGLIIGKGLLDNVLGDYLWAKAVLLTTPTAATAGLTIEVPIAAVVDALRGVVPSGVDVIGAVAVLIGFFGINQPATGCRNLSLESDEPNHEVEDTSLNYSVEKL